jgi:hypothetical protein
MLAGKYLEDLLIEKNQDFVIRSAKGEINGKTSKNTKQ